ncbi:tail fiber protein [Salmonella enterica]|nr:tail fiber protein [Salmonella enterica]EIM2942815.1 tail fiber protein [Escherichia coli]CTT98081.1 tail fiber protein [Escherichia coli]
MHRIDTKTAQKDKFGAGKNGFTRGNPQTGTPATDLDDDYFDMLQEELCSVVEASGASLEKGRHDQLLTALRALLLSRKNPFGDIKSDGTVQTALENLGIKNASTTQVGLVRLTSSRVSGAEDIAATANAVAQNYTDIKSLQNKTQDSTTTQKGIVQLTSSRVSESETLAATAKAAAMNYADIQALQGKTNDATPTNKGIIRVSDSRTSTESGVAASSLAASQNYSDMKGLFGQCGMKSRNLGVVYTNSQSFAIFVSVNAVLSDGSSFLSANVNVDGNSANFRGSQTTNLAGQRATIAFMVPAGATYIVQQFSGTVSDVTWVEVDKK